MWSVPRPGESGDRHCVVQDLPQEASVGRAVEKIAAPAQFQGLIHSLFEGVRPVNGIFKAKEGFGKMDRVTVLSCLPTSSHTTTPSSDGSQMRPGGARRDGPGRVWGEDRLGLRDGQASAASPDWRIGASGQAAVLRSAARDGC